MNLIFFGPPGSGKGTQAERLKERHTLKHISTGDLLRAAIADKIELGQQVESLLQAGDLVPDDIVLALIKDAIGTTRSNGFKGWLLDGFPRTVGQARGLENHMAELGEKIDAIIVLDVDREVILKRLGSRGRGDDGPGTVSKRLDVYAAQTRPTLSYYDGKVVINRIDGDQTMDEVTVQIERCLS